jgi:hypothetical protein
LTIWLAERAPDKIVDLLWNWLRESIYQSMAGC